jgi:hypothetical protein
MPVTIRRYTAFLVRIALLAVVLFGSNLWLVRMRDSILSHRSVLRGQPSLEGPSSPLVQQVVLLVISGLRYDASVHMPFLNSLREQGLAAPCRGYFPSHTQTAWTTLLSGAGPEINDAPLLDLPADELRFFTVDDLFTEAKRADLTTALVGLHWWQTMIPARLLDGSLFVQEAGAEADDLVVDAAVDLMDSLRPNFLLVHLTDVDRAARTFGANSPEYRAAARRADTHAQEIAQHMSLTRHVLIATSDHGHVDSGGHGGGEGEVLFTPFVMVGGRVTPRDYEQISQADIAPTISALLGLAVPSAAQGEILFDALLLDEAESTEKWVSWARQRVELADLYLESIGQEPLGEAAKGDAEIAYSSLLVRNYGSARRLAEFAVRGADEEMISSRASRIRTEQQRRLPLGLLPIGLAAYLLWRRWSKVTAVLLVAALATVVIYNLLYVWAGYPYSFSGLGDWDAFMAATITRMGAALIPGVWIVAWTVWQRRRKPPLEVAATYYGFALILALLLALPLIAGFVVNGTELTWYIPNPLFAFLQASALAQLAAAALLCLVIPLVTIPIDRIARWALAKASSV